MIFSTLIVVSIYAFINMLKEGISIYKADLFNSVSYNDAVGFSAYAYEGFGVILPVYDITKNKE